MLKLSIITICYNAEKTLQDAMDSVFMQTYPNYEYILINGLSKDSTEQIIKKNAPRLAHWQTEQDKGLYDALNKGVAKATGDVLAFLHADDMYADESVFERVVQIFEKENCDAVFGDLRFVAEDNVQETDYSKMSMKQLKDILSKKGIQSNARMKKNELINLIENGQSSNSTLNLNLVDEIVEVNI